MLAAVPSCRRSAGSTSTSAGSRCRTWPWRSRPATRRLYANILLTSGSSRPTASGSIPLPAAGTPGKASPTVSTLRGCALEPLMLEIAGPKTLLPRDANRWHHREGKLGG